VVRALPRFVAVSSPSIRFDVFELRPDSNELFKGGSKIKLKPQAARVLGILARRAGEAVPREEIRKALWGTDTFVDYDASLNSCITQLRSALGDDPETPRYIETVPRHGYRFVGRLLAPPPNVAEPARRRRLAVPALAAAVALVFLLLALLFLVWRAKPEERAMLLVGPFENLSGDESQDYLGAGLTEELITRAATLAPDELGVYARTTALSFERAELDYDYLLEGSFRREGSRIRITARLADGANGETLWTETYDRPAADVIDVQSDVAERVARAILPEARLDEYAGSTTSADAHRSYLEGRHRLAELNLPGLRLAAEAFERAVALDPEYARAWAGLADAYNLQSWFGGLRPEESARRGREAAEKALAAAPRLAEGYDALGFVHFYYDFDFEKAESRFRRALELQPGLAMTHYWYAGLLSATGRHEEAIARIRAASELDPLSPLINADAGWYYFYAGRYEEAIGECRRIVALDPDYAWAHECVAAAAMTSGREADALASRQELARIFKAPEPVRSRIHDASDVWARWLLERMESASPPLYVSPYGVALLKLDLGDRGGALDALEKAYRERDGFLVYAGVDLRLEPLHDEPRFRNLLGKLGLEAD
jgi:TolB-like protein/DNA-binding winged helix-turn-helix (wHTH) protein/Tfp pilus assembly protein PilF